MVEEDLEGKTDEEFEAQFEDKTHCSGCGECLEGYDMCQECGRINK